MKEAWLIGALFVAGCGDISSADSLFSPGGGGAPSGGSQGGESPSSSNVGGMSSTSVVSPTSTSTGPSVTSSTGTDTSVTTVASTSVSASVSSSEMASTGTGSGPMLACGDTTCPKGDDNACCSYIFNQGGGPSFSCTTTGSTDCNMDQFETVITCETSADCGFGKTCCGHRRMGQGPVYYDHVSCESSCTWPDGVTLCDPNGIDLTQCPFVQNQGNTVATHCQPSQLLPDGYNVCSP